MIIKTYHDRLKIIVRLFLIILSLTYTSKASAVLTIEIKDSQLTRQIPIAIVPFSMEGTPPDFINPESLIKRNIAFSGRFELIPRSFFINTPHDLKSVDFKDWRLINADAVVVGKVFQIMPNKLEVRFRLIDVYQEKQITGRKFTITTDQLRNVSHKISDIIFESLTGKRGAFDTKIAFVSVSKSTEKTKYNLNISDYDGAKNTTIFSSTHPIMSPAWSPDLEEIAYVSFEENSSAIYIQNVKTGKRKKIADYAGINSAPAWSPDGKDLAITLSKDGNPEIYIYNLGKKSLQRFTKNSAIDTEATWSPNGRDIVYTSNRSGSAQLYIGNRYSGERKRLTFEGSYNAGATFTPDGKSIVLVTNHGEGFQVGVFDLESKRTRRLTKTKNDEAPTISPNGEIILYATSQDGYSQIEAISFDGSIRQTLKSQSNQIIEPTWGNFTND